MSATGHALLSPSSSHRWINCTPSARLEEGVPDKGSVYAEEGSCAHALCEFKLLHYLNVETGGKYEQALKAARDEFEQGREKYSTDEMKEATDLYVSVVWEKYRDALKSTADAQLFVEKRLDFTKYIPDSFGTADAIIIADGMMEVIDFKYGKGVEVSATENTQMMIYALGALDAYSWEYDIRCVRMTIIQPRKQNISEYELSVDELDKWQEEKLTPAARKANKGDGEQKPGEWCRFCKVQAQCAKLAEQALSVHSEHKDKGLITAEQMPAILEVIPTIKKWCTAVEESALARAIDGEEFEGWKIVEGRSIRVVSDSGLLGARLEEAGATDIYKPKELRALGELEKLVGKKKFAELSDGCVIKPEGKPALVPLSDKRPPKNYSSAQKDFENIEIDE